MIWLNNLKIAIIEKNTDAIDDLLEELPKFENMEEMKEAQYILKEAAILLHTLKNETQTSMRQIEKNLSFLRATEAKSSTTLDIKS